MSLRSNDRSLLRNDTMRFSVLGLRSDIKIELQAPVALPSLKFTNDRASHDEAQSIISLCDFVYISVNPFDVCGVIF